MRNNLAINYNSDDSSLDSSPQADLPSSPATQPDDPSPPANPVPHFNDICLAVFGTHEKITSLPPRINPIPFPRELQDKFDSYAANGYDFSRALERKDFRNPCIYEKMIQFLRIDEFGSNFPSHVYSPKFPPECYYQNLLERQKAEMDRLAHLAETKKSSTRTERGRKGEFGSDLREESREEPEEGMTCYLLIPGKFRFIPFCVRCFQLEAP